MTDSSLYDSEDKIRENGQKRFVHDQRQVHRDQEEDRQGGHQREEQ